MLRSVRLYAVDAVVNVCAQVFLLLGGFISLFMGNAFLIWLIILIGYSAILAKMEQVCERKKETDIWHYIKFVLLPANMIALIAACIIVSAGYFTGNLILGIVVFFGSVAITVISVFCNRVLLR